VKTDSRAGVAVVCGAAALLCLLAGAGGCYHHIVSAKGIGTETVDIYEPNLKEDERVPIADDLADAVFGPKTVKPAKKKTR
jgi:hypothetical protein